MHPAPPAVSAAPPAAPTARIHRPVHGAAAILLLALAGAAACGPAADPTADPTAPPYFARHADGTVELFDGTRIPPLPDLLGVQEQFELRTGWVARKHRMLPDMMRRHGIDMWIVVNQEFHPDPVTEYVAPDLRYTERRGVLVFVDGGDDGLLAYSDLRRPTSDFAALFQPFPSARDARGFQDTGSGLRRLWEMHDPGTVAVNLGGRRGQDSGLTHDSWQWLRDTLGPEAEIRFVPAADLVEEYFDTRLPEELEHYRVLFEATDLLTRRVLSNEVITPGVTRAVDLKWWWEQQVADLGAGSDTWFEVHTAVQRYDAERGEMIEYVHPSPDDYVFQPGDIIHWDTGFNYLGFASDWQKVAYVLRDGETDVPEGLRRALANANRVHEAFRTAPRPGMTGWEATLAVAAELEGVDFLPSLYSHPLGYQGHALGPSINARNMDTSQAPAWDSVLRDGAYRSIEFSATSAVAEYDGLEVVIPMEDGAFLTPNGYAYLRPYQTEWYRIR